MSEPDNQDTRRPPTLKCPDCGGIFRTLDWWQPGMPCPSCNSRDISPVVEHAVDEESSEPAAEPPSQKAQELVREALDRKRWKQSPLIAGLAVVVILVALGTILVGGGGDNELGQPGRPFVCDTCGHRFKRMGGDMLLPEKCPDCRAASAWPAVVGICPHCHARFELYRVGAAAESVESLRDLYARIPEAPPDTQVDLEQKIDSKRCIKAPDGDWIPAADPKADAVRAAHGRTCPDCGKPLEGPVEQTGQW